MREDEDNIRKHFPVLRRLFILVAVLTAIPVALWTITAFMRTYVGPPRLPTFLPLTAAFAPPAAANKVAAPQQPAPPARTVQDTKSAPLPANVEAKVDTKPTTLDTDANAAAPDAKESGPSLAMVATAPPPAAADPPAATVVAPTPPDAGNTAADTSATPAPPANPPAGPAINWPPPPNSALGGVALMGSAPPAPLPPAADQTTVASLPPAQPIAGPIPLPRQRPRLFAVAQTGTPMPRARPEAAGPGPSVSDAPSSGPLDWLQTVLQPHPSSDNPEPPH